MERFARLVRKKLDTFKGDIPAYASAPERMFRPADAHDLGDRLAQDMARRQVPLAPVQDKRFTPWQIAKMPQNIRTETPQVVMRSANELQGTLNMRPNAYTRRYDVNALPIQGTPRLTHDNLQNSINQEDLNTAITVRRAARKRL